MAKPPIKVWARDDVATTTEDAPVTIDVLSNDRGGKAKWLYSVDQICPIDALKSTTLDSGATISIVKGRIVYDPGSAFQWLPNDQSTTDTFIYSMRVAFGAPKAADVRVTIQGQNDPAVIGGQDTGTVREDTTLTAAGTLTITDPDTGQSSFQAHDSTTPLTGAYGSLTIDANGNWLYTLDNNNADVQALNDTVAVQSTDGTSHDIAIMIQGTNEGPGLFDVERVSVSSTGEQANGNSYVPSISGDGRYVAYESAASTLVEGDTNGVNDIFVYDRETDTTQRVSVNSTGEQANGNSYVPSISGDGRYAAYYSFATNLVEGDTNGFADVFVFDRETDTTERVSVSSTGEQGTVGSYFPSLSDDGRYVAYYSGASNLVEGDTNEFFDIFVHDRETDTTERVSVSSTGEQANGNIYDPSISGDGRYVTYESVASNLVEGDTNGFLDIFVHDRVAGTTERVSVSSTGEQGTNDSCSSSLSGDGRYVAYESMAWNLVEGDTNWSSDVFVYDRETDTTERVSVSSTGEQANTSSGSSSISDDGRYVAYYSYASNLVEGDTNGFADVFVVDLQDFFMV